MTFAQFIAAVNSECQNKNTRTLTVLREVTIRQLKELSSFRTLFMEAEASFTLPVSSPHLGNYADSAVTNFPPDVMEIDRAWYVSGTDKREIDRVTMDHVRFYSGDYTVTTATSSSPQGWAWFAQKLYVVPRLNAAKAMGFDYFKDATRDTATGAVLTTASTTQTNPWFDRGELALRYAVLAEYYAMPATRDEAAIAPCVAMRNQFLDTLKTEYHLRKGGSGQAPAYFGGML